MMYQNFFFNFAGVNCTYGGAPAAQWVKGWPADLADLAVISRRLKLFQLESRSVARSLPFFPSHRPYMTEIQQFFRL